MIKKLLKKFITTAMTLAAGIFITGCASFKDNLTGIPVVSVSHYEKWKSVSQFLINNRGAGSNLHGGYSSPTSTISLERNFSGPLTLDVKWEVCNFLHYVRNKKEENAYCINEPHEAKVSVNVLKSPAESAYMYLHFFEDNTVEAWMVDNHPQSPDYPGPSFQRHIS